MTQKYQYHNIQYTGLHVSVEDIISTSFVKKVKHENLWNYLLKEK